MTDNKQARKKLQDELRKLFQYDVSDLDFGIYRILNRKKDQIEQFIEKDLLDAVNEGLKEYQQQESSQLDDIKQQIMENLSDDAFDVQGKLVKYENTKLGKDYLQALKKVEKQQVGADTEKKIYNDLFTFFSRYYSEGDFVTKRRISTRDSKYAVPYNGEEVLLHWANKDQYYIKTGEHFTNYKFEVDGKSVWFKVAEAEQDRDNVKEEEKRSFVLRPDNPIEVNDDELTVWFEYRPLTVEEEDQWLKVYNSVEKSRKTIDRQALCIAYDEWIRKEVDTEWRSALSLIPQNKDRTILYQKLNHYTGKNSTDYFIHKDLQSFLERELEYYLKNEVIRVDDFIEDQTEQALDVALTRAKVVKSIGKKIIAFLSQIENFQKKLFEKKKFVVDTHYCFTLDRVPEELYDTILKNEKQLKEWEKLYAMEKWSGELKWDGKWTYGFLKDHPFLILDTKFFDEEFKYELLVSVNDLEKNLGGLLINGDNFHALNIIKSKFSSSIQSVYTDPPYNTNASEIIYKNGYKNSSWLSLINGRLLLTKKLLRDEGILCITIDDLEYSKLFELLCEVFGSENHLATTPIRNNPSGRSTVSGFSVNHEYGIYFSNSRKLVSVGYLEHSEDQKQRYKFKEPDGRRYEWENLRRNGPDSNRPDRPKQYYPIFYDNQGEVRLPKINWYEKDKTWSLNEEPKESESICWPIHPDGTEKVWRYSAENIIEEPNRFKAELVDGRIEIYRKKYLNDKGLLPRTWWDKAAYSARDRGTRELVYLFGESYVFDFPKAVGAVMDSLRVLKCEKNNITLDFFAGSGTTGHAVLNLNKEDEGQRKYILVEMGKHFDSVLKPRIQKVAFSNNWKDGIPQDRDGQSHALKYHFIESYEDALNNIDFKNPEDTQQAMEFEDYMLSYMLDFETQGVSASLLKEGAFDTPFDYKLNIQRGHESAVEETVDLVETFHYLIGLWVQKLRKLEHQNRKYIISIGQIRDEDAVEDICIIWRNTKDLDLDEETGWIQKEIINGQTFDRIYINGVSKVKDAEPIEITFREKMFEVVA